MSTIKAINLQNPSSAIANIVTDANGNVTFGGAAVMSSSFLRNRIINGDMRIDQRSTAGNSNNEFGVDRWKIIISSTGTVQLLQSTLNPDGFDKSLLFDVVTADTSIATSEYAGLLQTIEGYNISDFGWGTSYAKSVTLSFWVYSTTIGTYCVSLRNGTTADLSYVAEYTVNVADTWEYKTITVPGPTTGTWSVEDTVGTYVSFCFAAGTTWQTTANSWNSGNFLGTANQTNLLASATNTIRITGVQLEVGTVATPFERQLYNTQLAQCQRYYYRFTATDTSYVCLGMVSSTTQLDCIIPFPVPMRKVPTALEQTGTAANYTILWGNGVNSCTVAPVFLGGTTIIGGSFRLTTTAVLTAGQAGICRILVNAYLGWSAEL